MCIGLDQKAKCRFRYYNWDINWDDLITPINSSHNFQN